MGQQLLAVASTLPGHLSRLSAPSAPRVSGHFGLLSGCLRHPALCSRRLLRRLRGRVLSYPAVPAAPGYVLGLAPGAKADGLRPSCPWLGLRGHVLSWRIVLASPGLLTAGTFSVSWPAIPASPGLCTAGMVVASCRLRRQAWMVSLRSTIHAAAGGTNPPLIPPERTNTYGIPLIF